jgi:hypothetical protein
VKRFVILALSAMAALLGVVCAPAAAAGEVPAASRPVPEVPLVIDGKWLAPKEISRFDGRPLYLIYDQRTPDVLVGFTKEAEANEYIAQRSGYAPSSAGEYIVIFSEDEKRGDSHTIPSGTSYNHLASLGRACGWFGCAGNWDNVISSVMLHGEATFFTEPSFGGGWLYAWGVNDWWFNMSTVGPEWNDQISSLHVHW